MHVVAGEFFWVFGFVLLASVVRDSVVMTEFVDTSWVSTIAGTTSMAVDDDLWSDGNTWEGVVTKDVNTISDGASSSMSPARSTIMRNVLVAKGG